MKTVIFAGALAALAGTASAGVLASTSFENAFVGSQYMDLGNAGADHDLVNNAGQSAVDFLNDGVEMGYDSYYRNTRNDVGLTDGDFVGATDFTGQVGSFTDGAQGFQMQDADGTMGVAFDTVAGTSMSLTLDLFINESGWESDDSIRIWVDGDAGMMDIFTTVGSDVDDLGVEGAWMNLNADLSAYTSVTLYVELESNSSGEALYLDNIVFSGNAIPTPGTMALLGLGGLVGARRRRA